MFYSTLHFAQCCLLPTINNLDEYIEQLANVQVRFKYIRAQKQILKY